MSDYDAGYGEEDNGTVYLEVSGQRTYDSYDWDARVPGQHAPFVDNPPEEWKAYIALPHQCSEWKIGSVDQAKQMIADLEAIIVKYESDEWRSE